MNLLILAAIGTFAPTPGPHVTNVAIYVAAPTAPKGYAIVTFDSEVSKQTPHCADGNPNSIAIDLSTPGGAMAAQELTRASMLQQPVKVTGSGKCDLVPNVESLASVEVGTRRE